MLKGTRIRDRRTGSLGYYQGTATLPGLTASHGSATYHLILWDGSSNATPWRWDTDALTYIDGTPAFS